MRAEAPAGGTAGLVLEEPVRADEDQTHEHQTAAMILIATASAGGEVPAVPGVVTQA